MLSKMFLTVRGRPADPNERKTERRVRDYLHQSTRTRIKIEAIASTGGFREELRASANFPKTSWTWNLKRAVVFLVKKPPKEASHTACIKDLELLQRFQGDHAPNKSIPILLGENKNAAEFFSRFLFKALAVLRLAS